MKQYFSFQWHITDDCDQRCKHCYIFAENMRKKLVSMSYDDMMTVLDKCEEFCNKFNRIPYFYITGGDPILHKHFWELLAVLKDRNYPFTIMGNPFHLTDRVCEQLKNYGCQKYQMSIDGCESTHDWFRKKGSYKTTLEKVSMLNKAGIRSVIMTTVSGINIQEVPQIIDAVVKAGVNVYAFSRYCPTSTNKALKSDPSYIEPMEYRKLLEICDRKFKEYEKQGCETYFNRKDHLWTLYEYEIGEFIIPANTEKDMIYGGCNCGNCHITITPAGDVYACRRVQNSKVGNLYETSLVELWLSELEKYRDFSFFKKCSKCELMPWCRGCPAVASGISGDFYAPDPQCWKEIPEDISTKFTNQSIRVRVV